MKILSNSKRRGFTLIELLVVIAIIGLLTGIVVANLTTSRAKARDAKRVSDLGQIQLAVELFFDRCNSYPSELDVDYVCEDRSDVLLSNYISRMPTDPISGNAYIYGVEDDSYPYSDYMLRTTLESYSEVLKDDDDSNVTRYVNGGEENVDCSDEPEFNYCIGAN